MNQSERIVAALAKGDATFAQLAGRTGIPENSLSAVMSMLKRDGLVVRRNEAAPRRTAAVFGLPAPPVVEAEPDEETPPARAVAAAVVAAAAILGEAPLAIAEPDTWLRCRAPALKALQVFYPECPLASLGRYVGAKSDVARLVRSAESATWWPDLGDAAFEAAMSALEAL